MFCGGGRTNFAPIGLSPSRPPGLAQGRVDELHRDQRRHPTGSWRWAARVDSRVWTGQRVLSPSEECLRVPKRFNDEQAQIASRHVVCFDDGPQTSSLGWECTGRTRCVPDVRPGKLSAMSYGPSAPFGQRSSVAGGSCNPTVRHFALELGHGNGMTRSHFHLRTARDACHHRSEPAQVLGGTGTGVRSSSRGLAQ